MAAGFNATVSHSASPSRSASCRPPINDELGQRIYQNICADCWQDWLRNYSVKVINELRLDLSREDHQAQYDEYMRASLVLNSAQRRGGLPLAA